MVPSKFDTCVKATSFVQENEEGVRVVFIQSRGSGFGINNNGGGGGGGGVKILEVPKDTDYLELIMFYSGIDPRGLRKDKIKILRVASTGQNPYLSKNTQRYWTSYNFGEQYDRGGPFDLVRPYDIIIVQQRGLFNREIFDPITDINFLLTLPTFIFSIVTVYNTFIHCDYKNTHKHKRLLFESDFNSKWKFIKFVR